MTLPPSTHLLDAQRITYSKAEAFLYELRLFGTKLGLANITRLLDLLGSPQNKLFFVHIAGTNGKGSVSAILNATLTSAGLKTGLFTSPHLVSLRERFKINNHSISPQSFTRHFIRVKNALDQLNEQRIYPTFFEVITAMAIDYFACQGVEVVLLETGMGGSFDATNVVTSDISVITTVALDHCKYLGTTIEAIARDKAGIINPGSLFVTGSEEPSALSVFEEVCRSKDVPMTVSSMQHINLKKRTDSGMIFDYDDGDLSLSDIKTNLVASYQLKNCAVALQVIQEIMRRKQFDKSWFEQALHGLKQVKIKGRFQIIQRTPPIILDGAHNPAAMLALKETIADVYPGWRVHLLLGILADKDYQQMCGIIAPVADRIDCITVPSGRSLPAGTLAECCRQYAPEEIQVEAVTSANKVIDQFNDNYTRSDKTVLLICGSLYLIGDVLALRKKSPYKTVDSGNDYR